jgi:CheY-like chemotaxis protein/ribosomal protein S27E
MVRRDGRVGARLALEGVAPGNTGDPTRTMAMRSRNERFDPDDRQRFVAEVRVVEAVLRSYPDGTMVGFGAPTRCPECSNYGIVHSTNDRLGVCRNRCLSCGTQWVLTRRAIEHAALRMDPAAAAAGSTGPDVAVPRPQGARPAAPSLGGAFARWSPQPAPSLRDLARSGAEEPLPASEVAGEAVGTDRLPARLRVLVVGSNAFDGTAIESIVGPLDDAVELVFASSPSDAHERVRSPLDVALLAAGSPGEPDPTTVMAEWQQHMSPGVPVILLTETADATTADQAQALGAAYIVDNSQLERLADDPRGAARLLRLLTVTVAKHRNGDRVRFAI